MERASLLRQPFAQSVVEEDRPLFLAHLKEVFGSAEKKDCELRLQRKDRSVLFVRMESVALDEGFDGQVRCLTTVLDVTRRKQAEQAQKELNDELKKRSDELEAVNRELEAFSYTVSHDLKNPLRGIEGFTRALVEDYTDKLDDTGRDYLNRVNGASRRMSQLIEAMLTLARLTRGELRERTVNLSDIARIKAHELRQKEPERRVEFVIAEGVKARGDMEMLRSVSENLIDNAWKFTSKHPSGKIEFGVAQREGEMVYYMQDDGAGFDMEYANKLFLPFKRLHSESEFPGLGIGLATAHRIIRRHGGKMWVEGEVEKGAAFYFTLGEVPLP